MGEALDASVASLEAGQTSCESAISQFGLVDDQNSAEEVARHLGVSSNHLAQAVIEVSEALAKIEEAQESAAEIGQQGMMQATTNLFDQVSELHRRIVVQQGASAGEKAQAAAYAERQGGN